MVLHIQAMNPFSTAVSGRSMRSGSQSSPTSEHPRTNLLVVLEYCSREVEYEMAGEFNFRTEEDRHSSKMQHSANLAMIASVLAALIALWYKTFT